MPVDFNAARKKANERYGAKYTGGEKQAVDFEAAKRRAKERYGTSYGTETAQKRPQENRDTRDVRMRAAYAARQEDAVQRYSGLSGDELRAEAKRIRDTGQKVNPAQTAFDRWEENRKTAIANQNRLDLLKKTLGYSYVTDEAKRSISAQIAELEAGPLANSRPENFVAGVAGNIKAALSVVGDTLVQIERNRAQELVNNPNINTQEFELEVLRQMTESEISLAAERKGHDLTPEEVEEMSAEYNRAKAALDAQRVKTPVSMESKGMQMLTEARQHAQKASEGLPAAGKWVVDKSGSIAQNAALAPLSVVSGGLPLVAMAAISGANKMYDVSAAGGSPQEAFGRGTVSAIIEGMTEKIPLDSFLSMAKGAKGGLKNVVNNLLQQAGTEATEEGISYAMNYLADVAAGDPNAEFTVAELLQNMAAGGFSGGVFGISGSAIGQFTQGAAQDMAEMRPPARGVVAQTQEARPAQQTEVQRAAEVQTKQAKAPVQETASEMKAPVQENVERAADTFGRSGQKAYTSSVGENASPDVYAAWAATYEAAREGKADPASASVLSSTQRFAARAAGKNDAPGLFRDSNLKKVNLDTRTERALDAIGRTVGAQVRFVESIDAGEGRTANGKYENGVIEIALDGDDPVRTVFSHELTHRIRAAAPEAYQALADFVSAHMDGESFGRQVEVKAGQYGAGLPVATEEVIADAVGYLMEDSKLLDRFVTENRSAGQKLLDAIRDLIRQIQTALTGGKARLTDDQRAVYADLRLHLEGLEATLEGAIRRVEQEQATAREGEGAGRSFVEYQEAGGRGVHQDQRGSFRAKFSLTQPVEETRDLLALHNLTEDKLRMTLALGAFPMPSVAVTRRDVPHTQFGEISVVFDQAAIDPARRWNRVYSADAFTVTFPELEYDIDRQTVSRLEDELYPLARKQGDEFGRKALVFLNRLEDTAIDQGGIQGVIRAAMEDGGMQAAYGSAMGISMPHEGNNDAMDRAAFEQWLQERFEGVVGESGLSNGEDPFDSLGNRRPFQDTHVPATLENILAVMRRTAREEKENAWFDAFETLRAAMADTFQSMDDIRAAKGRIRQMPEEQYTALVNAAQGRFEALVEEVAGEKGGILAEYEVGEVIRKAAAKKKRTPAELKSRLEKAGYPVEDSTAAKISAALDDIAKLPTTLFEAKPERAVGFDEMLAVVVPSDLGAELRGELEDRGITVIEYEKGDTASRLKAVNSVERAAFSLKAPKAPGGEGVRRRSAGERLPRGENARTGQKAEAAREQSRDKEAAWEGRTAREQRQRVIRHAGALGRELLRPGDTRHIPDSLRGAVAAMLNSINMERAYTIAPDTGRRGKNAPGAPVKRTEAFMELRRAYQEVVDSEGGAGMVIDPDLQDNIDAVVAMGDIKLANMSTAQLQTIWETVKAVEASVSSANRLLVRGRFATVLDLAEDMRETLRGKKVKQEYGGVRGKVDRFLNMEMLNPVDYFHRLGEAGEAIWKSLRGAQDTYITRLAQAQEDAKKILDSADIKTWSGKSAKAQAFDVVGGRIALTPAQVMYLYKAMERPQVKQHILKGGIRQMPITDSKGKVTRSYEPVKVTEADVARITATLTGQQRAVADAMGEYMSGQLAEWGNGASMAAYGYKKFTEGNDIPISVDPNFTFTDSAAGQDVTIRGRGFTKATEPKATNAIMVGDVFDVFTKHTNDMITYSAYLTAVEDAERVKNFRYRDKETFKTIGSVKTELERALGSGGVSYFENLMRDVNQGVRTAARGFSLDQLTGPYKAAAIGANIRVMVQQPTAYLRASALIDPKYLTGAAAVRGAGERMTKYAPIATWKDWGYFEVGNGRQIRDILLGSDSALEKTKSAQMAPAGFMDNLTWGRLWAACELEVADKNRALAKGSDAFYEAVAERFGEVIDKTQVVDGILQRSQVMREGDKLTKMAVSFLSEPTKAYNVFVTAMNDAISTQEPAARTAARKKFARSIAALLVTGIVNAMVVSFVDALRDDDKKLDYWEKWLAAFTGVKDGKATVAGVLSGNIGDELNPLAKIPGAKDVLSLWQGYDVSRMDTAALSKLFGSVNRVWKSFAGDGTLTKGNAVVDMLASASMVYGVPVANIKRDVLASVRSGMEWSGAIRPRYEMDI